MLGRSRQLLSRRSGLLDSLETGIFALEGSLSNPAHLSGTSGFSAIASRTASHGLASASSDLQQGYPWATSGGLGSVAASSPLIMGLQSQQCRTFFGPFRRSPSVTSDPAPLAVEDIPEPPLDMDLVNRIVDMSVGTGADALAWEGIHHGVWYHTYAAQCLLRTVHDFGNLGSELTWPLAMLCCVGILRMCTVPLMITQMKMGFNMQKSKPHMEQLQRDMMKQIEQGGDAAKAQMEYAVKLQEVWKKYKSNPVMTLVPLFVNLPLFMGFYFGVNTMCEGSLPSLITEGLPWAPDLTKVDPYHVLNLAVPLTLFVQVQLGGFDGLEAMEETQKKYFTWFLKGAPVLMVPVMWNFPAAMCLYWTYSNCFSVIQSGALKVPAVRKVVGLPPRQEMIDLAMANRNAPSHSAFDFMSKMSEALDKSKGVTATAVGNTPAQKASADVVPTPRASLVRRSQMPRRKAKK